MELCTLVEYIFRIRENLKLRYVSCCEDWIRGGKKGLWGQFVILAVKSTE